MSVRAYLFTAIIFAFLSLNNAKANTVTTKKLSDSLYVFYAGQGLGLNVTASIGKDGILLIDTMNIRKEGNKKLLAAIRKVSDKPIKYVINTDSDSVHIGGYTYFSKLGATIIAQQDANISDEITTLKFKDSLVINFNDQIFEIYHHVANSFDDAIIYLPKSNLIVTGNIYAKNWFPVFFSGGIKGFNTALENVLALANNNTKILPSTGELSNIASLRQYQNNSNEMIARIHQLKLLEHQTETIAKDKQLNEIWLRMIDSDRLNDKIKTKMVNRYISTDFIAAFPLTSDKLADYLGHYRYEDNANASIILRNNTLLINEGSLGELIPQSRSLFHVRGSLGDSVQFEFNKNKEVIALTYISQGKKYKALKQSTPNQ